MATDTRLKIVIVSAFYSKGMGYSENCLSRALAHLGHEVHVVTSTFNVYANEPLYEQTYREFLGPGQTAPGTQTVDGYTVHRLESSLRFGYVRIKGLASTVRALAPDIVHSLEIGAFQTWELAIAKPFARFKLFCETHQTLSVMRPYMLRPKGHWAERLVYRATRTLPTSLASLAVEKCWAVTPDCLEVAARFYGVPRAKLALLSLGADTETFHPVESAAEERRREEVRSALGFSEKDLVCVYTGRFTVDKNPLALAKAVDMLSADHPGIKGLFIGDGPQRQEIAACRNTTIIPFMTHASLAEHYRAADVGVWPRQESMSMIDAASSGVPLVVSDRIGEPDRVRGNGVMYEENDVPSLCTAILGLRDAGARRTLGRLGREKMLRAFSWMEFARTVEADFLDAVSRRDTAPGHVLLEGQ